jgi:hypothetical protein
MRDVGADFGPDLREFNGGAEHVYLVGFPLTAAISRLVNSPTGVSYRRVRQEFPDLCRRYRRLSALVRGHTFAGSVGPDLCPAPVNRTAEPSRPTSSHPAAFTTGPKGRHTGGHIGSSGAVRAECKAGLTRKATLLL